MLCLGSNKSSEECLFRKCKRELIQSVSKWYIPSRIYYVQGYHQEYNIYRVTIKNILYTGLPSRIYYTYIIHTSKIYYIHPRLS